MSSTLFPRYSVDTSEDRREHPRGRRREQARARGGERARNYCIHCGWLVVCIVRDDDKVLLHSFPTDPNVAAIGSRLEACHARAHGRESSQVSVFPFSSWLARSEWDYLVVVDTSTTAVSALDRPSLFLVRFGEDDVAWEERQSKAARRQGKHSDHLVNTHWMDGCRMGGN